MTGDYIGTEPYTLYRDYYMYLLLHSLLTLAKMKEQLVARTTASE